MPEIGEILADEELKSKAAAVGAGILVIIAGFLVYNYFSKVGKEAGVVEKEAAVSEQEQSEEGENVEEEAPKEEAAKAEKPKGEKAETEETPKAWKANNYNPGDIGGGSYTVKRGDTLWEIAEARYGSGFSWTKILEANKDQIGFLPNGQQSLIHVGDILALP